MATCTIETGMLFWKKACGAPPAGKCRNCGREICGMHAGDMGDGTLICVACVENDPIGAMSGSRGAPDSGLKETMPGPAAPPPGVNASPQTAADLNAQLLRDFPLSKPILENVAWRGFGESRVAVGLLAITRRDSGQSRIAIGPVGIKGHAETYQDPLTKTYTEIQSAAAFSSATLRFPGFDLHPANLAFNVAERAAQLILRTGNFGKIDFPQHPEFSRRYRVQSFDAERTRWLFDDRVLAHMAGREGLTLSAANGSLLLYRAGTKLSGDMLEAFSKEAVEVFRVFEAAARR